jgi:hypothetical protein
MCGVVDIAFASEDPGSNQARVYVCKASLESHNIAVVTQSTYCALFVCVKREIKALATKIHL